VEEKGLNPGRIERRGGAVDESGRGNSRIGHDQRARERQLACELTEPAERPVAEDDARSQVKVEGGKAETILHSWPGEIR